MGFFDRFRKKAEPTTAPAAPARAASVAPPAVAEMAVEELRARLDRGETPVLLDVREPWEIATVSLPGALSMPMNTIPARLSQLDKEAEIVVYCHHGTRSWNVAVYLAGQGFRNVRNLTGGIDAWARRVEPTMRRY
jgi:rhodanese-related sulfurtransferase